MVLQSLADNHFALHRALYGQRVEEIAVVLLVAIFFKLLGKPLCLFVDSGGDATDTLRPVPGGIEAAHDGHQSLRCADVGCGSFALDVLFTHTQSHTQCLVALGIDSPADDTSGEGPFESIGDCEECGVRTAEAHRRTETLCGTEDAVGAHLARSLQQRKGHQVGSDTDKDALLMRLGNEFRVVANLTELAGILHNRAEIAAVQLNLAGIAGHNLDVARGCVGADHVKSLRKHALVHKELADIVLHRLTGAGVVEHDHALAACGRLIQQGGVCQRHAGHVGNHGLEGHQGLQTAL